jgi:hypothetical protein
MNDDLFAGKLLFFLSFLFLPVLNNDITDNLSLMDDSCLANKFPQELATGG